jgi:uncharacterized protein (TIGR02996 family)
VTDYPRQYSRQIARYARSDHEPFLNAIEADPLDPAPRLVYADWLDDRGLPDEADRQRVAAKIPVVVYPSVGSELRRRGVVGTVESDGSAYPGHHVLVSRIGSTHYITPVNARGMTAGPTYSVPYSNDIDEEAAYVKRRIANAVSSVIDDPKFDPRSVGHETPERFRRGGYPSQYSRSLRAAGHNGDD